MILFIIDATSKILLALVVTGHKTPLSTLWVVVFVVVGEFEKKIVYFVFDHVLNTAVIYIRPTN